MNGFCSAPTPDKRREKHLVLLLAILGILLFALSGLPGMLLPALWQILAVASLTFAVYVLALCLLRRYVYAIEPRENAPAEAPLDLTVTQICGKRRTVVARFSVNITAINIAIRTSKVDILHCTHLTLAALLLGVE